MKIACFVFSYNIILFLFYVKDGYDIGYDVTANLKQINKCKALFFLVKIIFFFNY